MGVPTRSFEADGRHAWSVALAAVLGWLVVAPELVELVCEATFEITGGKVQSYQWRSNACGQCRASHAMSRIGLARPSAWGEKRT